MPISSPSTGRASTSPRSPAIRWAGTRRSPAPARSSAEHGFAIVDAMGENSQAGEPGGQVLLTLVDEDWREVPGLRDAVLALVEAIDGRPARRSTSRSTSAACWSSPATRPASPPCSPKRRRRPAREPLRLVNHGPFHTPADAGLVGPRLASFPPTGSARRDVPMIDGRGHIWRPLRQRRRGAAALHLRHPDPRNLRFHPRRPGRGARNMRPTGSSCSAPATRSAARSPRR